jgi:hypothetical protein
MGRYPVCREWFRRAERQWLLRRVTIIVVLCVAAAAVLEALPVPSPQRAAGVESQAEVYAQAFWEELGVGRPMPPTPLSKQKRPPCTGKQVEVRGGCWYRLDLDPGDDQCGEVYLYEGRCYLPVHRPDPAPVTVEPARPVEE